MRQLQRCMSGSNEKTNNGGAVTISSLRKKHREGLDLDKPVPSYVRKLRADGIVNSDVVVAAGMFFVRLWWKT